MLYLIGWLFLGCVALAALIGLLYLVLIDTDPQFTTHRLDEIDNNELIRKMRGDNVPE